MTVATLKFAAVLSGVAVALKACRMLYPEFAARLKERNLVAQIIARDEEVGRWFTYRRRPRALARAGAIRSPTSRSASRTRRSARSC